MRLHGSVALRGNKAHVPNYKHFLGYAQMSGFSTSSQLDDHSQFKLYSHLIPSDDGTAISVILYLRDVITTDHSVVVHNNNPYSRKSTMDC